MNPPSGFSLALLLVLATFALIIGAVSASTPAVPEFTVKYVDASYDVPTTHSIDPYTGQDVTHQGYHVQNRTIQVSIKNVPFTAYESDGQIINYYLNIRVKGSYANDWLNVYNPDNGYLTQSNSSYTTVSFSLDDNYFPFWNNIPGGGTIDIEVKALIGSVHRIQNVTATDPLSMYPWIFDGQFSEWSSTQTVTVLSSSATAQPSATTESPSSSGAPVPADSMQVNDLVIIVLSVSAVIIVVIIAVAAVLIKKAKTHIATAAPN